MITKALIAFSLLPLESEQMPNLLLLTLEPLPLGILAPKLKKITILTVLESVPKLPELLPILWLLLIPIEPKLFPKPSEPETLWLF